MKKIVLIALTIFSSFFLTDYVSAIEDSVSDQGGSNILSCTYGIFDAASSSEAEFDAKVTLDINPTSRTVKINYGASPEIVDGCKGVADDDKLIAEDGSKVNCTSVTLTSMSGDVSKHFSAMFGDYNNTEVLDGLFSSNKCEDVLQVYIKSGGDYCYSFNEDTPTCDGFENFKNEPTQYFEQNTDKDKTDEILKENCFFFGVYKRELEKTIADGTCEGNSDFTRVYQKFSSRCANYLSSHLYTKEGEKDGETYYYANPCSSKCAALRDTISTMCNSDDTNSENCGSLGSRLLTWIYRMIKFVRYGVPALLIILSILDFIKAIASESDDEMKKVTARFTKRLIAAALIFIIPFILDFILRMFNIPGLNSDNPFCAKSV